MADFSLILDGSTARALAVKCCNQADPGTVVEFTKSDRTLEQNAALHGLLAQVLKQKPTLNGVKMNVPLYKAVFMDALGDEVRMMPKLEGNGFFPLGHSTSKLGKQRFSELLELILAWSASQGLTVKHFDEPTPSTSSQGGGGAKNLASEAV